DAVHRALDHDPSCPLSLAIDGSIATVLDHDFARAEQRFAAAMCLNPSSAMIRHLASVLATSQADGPRALDLTESAYRLSPRDPRKTFFDGISAGCHVAGGRYSRAIDLAEAALQHNPLHLSAHRSRVIALQLDGQAEAAHQAAQKLLELDPDFRVGDYLNTHPAAATAAGKSWAHALGDAGIPYS
ncbi:MAG: tetratricopeptide repeat protein, partial [Pseudomonadota bacterium]